MIRFLTILAVCLVAFCCFTAILEAQPPGFTRVCEGGVCRLVPNSQLRSVVVPQARPQVQAPQPKPVAYSNAQIMELEEVTFCAECPSGYQTTGRKVLVLMPGGFCKCGPGCTCATD